MAHVKEHSKPVTAVVGAGWVFGQGLGLPAGLSGLTGPALLPDWSNRGG